MINKSTPATCDICGKPLPMTNINDKPTFCGFDPTPVLDNHDGACCKECFDYYVSPAHKFIRTKDADGMMKLAHEIIGHNPISRKRIDRRGRAAAFTRLHGLALLMSGDIDWNVAKGMRDQLEDMHAKLEEMWPVCEDLADIAEVVAYSADDDVVIRDMPESARLDFYAIAEHGLAEVAGYDLYSVKVKLEDDVLPQMPKLLAAANHLPMVKAIRMTDGTEG